MARKHLIIGCGTAALAALERLRRLNRQDEVKLVSREDHPPYSPTALPYLIAGRTDEARLHLRDNAFFSAMGARLELGREVVAIQPQAGQVHYRDGERESYDTLLIATGSCPVKPPLPGLDSAGFYFHTLADCRRLLAHLQEKGEVVVLGGGLVGMELACSLRERGFSVSVVEKEPHLLPLYFEDETSRLIESILRSQGVGLHTGTEVVGVEQAGDRVRLAFAGSGSLEGDALVVAVGVVPHLDVLNGAGIATRQGILVDRGMTTSREGVFAAGDAAEAASFFTGEPGVNATLPTAVAQGRVAGARMAGEPAQYPGWIPMNLFNFFGHVALSLGVPRAPGDGAEVQEKMERGQFKRLVFAQDRLIGAMFVDYPGVNPGALFYLIEHRVELSAYKDALWQSPGEVALALVRQEEKRRTRSLEG